MGAPNKFRARLALLEVALLVVGFGAWAALPIVNALALSETPTEELYFLVPVGWVFIGGSVATMALRFAHWAVERVRGAKDRLGLR